MLPRGPGGAEIAEELRAALRARPDAWSGKRRGQLRMGRLPKEDHGGKAGRILRLRNTLRNASQVTRLPARGFLGRPRGEGFLEQLGKGRISTEGLGASASKEHAGNPSGRFRLQRMPSALGDWGPGSVRESVLLVGPAEGRAQADWSMAGSTASSSCSEPAPGELAARTGPSRCGQGGRQTPITTL